MKVITTEISNQAHQYIEQLAAQTNLSPEVFVGQMLEFFLELGSLSTNFGPSTRCSPGTLRPIVKPQFVLLVIR